MEAVSQAATVDIKEGTAASGKTYYDVTKNGVNNVCLTHMMAALFNTKAGNTNTSPVACPYKDKCRRVHSDFSGVTDQICENLPDCGHNSWPKEWRDGIGAGATPAPAAGS